MPSLSNKFLLFFTVSAMLIILSFSIVAQYELPFGGSVPATNDGSEQPIGGAGIGSGINIVDTGPVRVRTEDVATTQKSWNGDVECSIGSQKLKGEWQYEVINGALSGQVYFPELGTGVLAGTVEGSYVDATVVYNAFGQRGEFPWTGTVTEKNIEGTTAVGVPGQVGECIWGGEAVLDITYGTIVTVTENNSIKITYVPICLENCTKIVFVQTVCRKAVFDDNSEAAFKPGEIDPAWAEKNDVTVNGGRLCTVDYTIGEKDPYYNGDDGQDGGVQGKHAGSLNASMRDAPRYFDAAFQNLAAKFGKNVKKVILEFEVCSVCAEGRDAGKIYGCMKWNYEQEKGKQGSAIDRGSSGTLSSEKFKEALKKWAEVKKFGLPAIR